MPNQTSWNDDELLAALRGVTVLEKRRAEEYMATRWGPGAKGFIVKSGGSFEEAEEIFNDAFIDFCRRVREGAYEGKSALQGYLMGFVKNYWAKTRVKQGRRFRLFEKYKEETLQETGQAGGAERFENEEMIQFLYSLLETTGKHCRKIQQLYGEGFELREILEQMPELKTVDRVKTEKKRCTDRMEAELKKLPAEWIFIFEAYFNRKSRRKTNL